jgi:hypothetical protein
MTPVKTIKTTSFSAISIIIWQLFELLKIAGHKGGPAFTSKIFITTGPLVKLTCTRF